MEVYKDNILATEEAFEFLSKLDPDIALTMMRNRIAIVSTSDSDRLSVIVLNSWIRENCEGLVYCIDKSGSYRDHYVYQFEKPEEAVAFKLRWT